MARLEKIALRMYRLSEPEAKKRWDKASSESNGVLPQIFWKGGSSWDEVNVWAFSKRQAGIKTERLMSLMKGLHRYAIYLEESQLDWRHFPRRRDEQVLRRFRGYLIGTIHDGVYTSSTVRETMNSVVDFYRFALTHNLVGVQGPLWADKRSVVSLVDTTGFQRSMVRHGTDLAIPNAKRIGMSLEDGLMPLSESDANELMAFSADNCTHELHLMLSIGLLTGARVGTIVTLTTASLGRAVQHPRIEHLLLLAVGPGTGIATKFDVQGDLEIPLALYEDLRRYQFSARRLLREAKAAPQDKQRLFLTKNGLPYTVQTVDALVSEMRSSARGRTIGWMKQFKFHQTRATFGTSRVKILLDLGLSPSEAVGLVRDSMHHLNEKTTFAYITFVKNCAAKEKLATEFYEKMMGTRSRDWESIRV